MFQLWCARTKLTRLQNDEGTYPPSSTAPVSLGSTRRTQQGQATQTKTDADAGAGERDGSITTRFEGALEIGGGVGPNDNFLLFSRLMSWAGPKITTVRCYIVVVPSRAGTRWGLFMGWPETSTVYRISSLN